ncbi:MAG: T9SS type A sorting domain-containing protein, partial [Flavobacteriales bacterium]|nr:T9SS type A sorting domain-containing protein [Flavobacteriales bacterium]
SQTSTTFSSSQGNAIVDIPLNAPTGYYDVILEDPPLGPWVLPNGFYVHAGNQISGLVYVDLNGNQVYDGGDAPYPYAVVESTPTGFLSMSQSNGVYTGYLPAGSHQLEVDVPYYNSSPASHNANFGGSGSSLSGLDFALQPIAGQRDMRISMNAGNVRTGRNMTLNILIENVGTTAETGQIELTFPVGMSFVSSSNQNYSVNGNMVTVNYVNVLPLEDRQIQLTLFTPLTITAGQTVDFMGTVDDINNDLTPLDNTFLLENVVVNSYDPNIKEVSPLSYIDQSFVDNGEYLYYTVHFQNTGTASAIDVYILDTISDLIEYNTFQFLTSSHDCEVNFLNDRIVEFRFDGINLPDSTSNEEESKGFVSYRVKPIGSLQEEEYILNTAHIYFDFNEAIVTNTTENWIPISVGLSESNADRYSIYPNPNNGVFWIQADRLKEYKVFSSTGQLVTQRSRQLSDKMIIDLDGNDSGVYFIELYAKNGVVRKKLVLIRE